jgi:hypothetical protein
MCVHLSMLLLLLLVVHVMCLASLHALATKRGGITIMQCSKASCVLHPSAAFSKLQQTQLLDDC